MIHIEEDEEEGDYWGFKDIFFSSSNENKNLYDFNPYYNPRSPFILTIEITQKGMFILLRNGLIIKLSNEQRKIYSIYSNSQYDINRSKIVDISCRTAYISKRKRL